VKCENIMLQYHIRIVTTCHFVPKILTIKKWVHFFFGLLCTCNVKAHLDEERCW
jgi:hypothetical protein